MLIVKLPASSIAMLIHDKWELVPLRVPTAWSIRFNGIDARRLSTGDYEVNASQDLFWAEIERGGREMTIDGGYYTHDEGGAFRICVLEPDWDHVTDTYSTPFFDDFVSKLEMRLLAIATGT